MNTNRIPTIVKISDDEVIRACECSIMSERDLVEMMGEEICGGRFGNIDISIMLRRGTIIYKGEKYTSTQKYPTELWKIIDNDELFGSEEVITEGFNDYYMEVKLDEKTLYIEDIEDYDYGEIPLGEIVKRLEDIHAYVLDEIRERE